MAYVYRTYSCDNCGDSFEVFQSRDDGPPGACEKCGYVFDVPKLPIPSGFRITTAGPKAADASVRQYFDATAAAAEEAGNPGLKVTNIKDNVRQGETYAMPPQPSKEYQAYTQQAGGAGFGPQMGNGMNRPAVPGMDLSIQQAVNMGRADGMAGTGAPVLRGMQQDLSAPHRRLAGRFNRSAV